MATERIALVPPEADVEEVATQRLLRLPELDAPTFRYDPNRRSSRRAAVEVPAIVEAGKKRVAFTIENLSVGGARLTGSTPLTVGEQLVIAFSLAGTRLVVTGEVVRIHTEDLLTDQVAVRFVEPSAVVVSCIEDFITSLLGNVGQTPTPGSANA